MINAQVTAVTCFLEISSNLLYQIIVKLAVKTSFATLLQFLIIYLIILPYSFLMNTSHNKNRVIEHGWKNVFKNIAGKKNNEISPEILSSMESKSQNQNQLIDDSERMNRNNIFTTIASKDTRKGTTDCSGPRVIPPIASTSNGQLGTAPPKRKSSDSSLSSSDSIDLTFGSYSKESSSCNSLILSADILNIKDKKQIFALKLIQKMSEAKDDEEKFLEHFKRLVSYEVFRKDKESFGVNELENEIFISHDNLMKVINTHGKSKGNKTKVKRKYNTSRNKVGISSKENKESEQTSFQECLKTERTIMRTDILSKLSSCYRKDFNYDSLINELIDLEEGFVR